MVAFFFFFSPIDACQTFYSGKYELSESTDTGVEFDTAFGTCLYACV